MQQRTAALPRPGSGWTRVSPPAHGPVTATPIYDALVRTWQQQGRQIPRPQAEESYEGTGYRPRPSRHW
jgi:hypothetical protein